MMFMMTTPPTTSEMEEMPMMTSKNNRGELLPDVHEGVVGIDLEVVGLAGGVVAASAHHDAHLVFSALHGDGAAAGAHVDAQRVVVAVGLQVGGDGHGHPVVLRLAQRFSLAVADADDGIRDAVDANLFAEWVSIAQQVVHNVVTHNDVVGAYVVVGGRKSASYHNVEVVEQSTMVQVNATHIGISAGMAIEGDFSGAANGRAHLGTFGALVPHRLVVFVLQDLALLILEVLLGGETAACGETPHAEHISAVADELGGYVVVGSVNQSDDHDDRCHAHHHAQQREDGTHLVGPQGLQREFDCLTKKHGPAFCCQVRLRFLIYYASRVKSNRRFFDSPFRRAKLQVSV
jgi:hypothetical protein